MKSIYFIILIALASFLLTACSNGVSSEKDFEYEINDDGAVITSYIGTCKDVIVPQQIKGISVVKIGDNAFEDSDMHSIVLPDNLTEIDDWAFSQCTELTYVKLPSNLMRIGTLAFCNCEKLKEIEFGSNLECISDEAFYGCESLTSIELPASVIELGNNIFSGCSSLNSITTAKNSSCFASVDGVLFDKSLSIIYAYPPQKENHFFAVPESVNIIADYAFTDNTHLANITFPEGLRNIGEYAFAGCASLTDINIPSSVESMGDFAFARCISLANISVAEDNKNLCSVDGVLFDKSMAQLLRYPAAKTDTVYVIPEGVCILDIHSFANNRYLQNISFPSSLQLIDSGAFFECSALKTLSLPNSLVGIGTFTFSNCTALTEVYIPGSVDNITVGVFMGCISLDKVIIGNGVTVIGDMVFSDCNSLKEIIIPDSVTKINSMCFNTDITIYGCANSYAEQYAKENNFTFVAQ